LPRASLLETDTGVVEPELAGVAGASVSARPVPSNTAATTTADTVPPPKAAIQRPRSRGGGGGGAAGISA
jgi:hypothetical protein